jgi:hypothetical protein
MQQFICKAFDLLVLILVFVTPSWKTARYRSVTSELSHERHGCAACLKFWILTSLKLGKVSFWKYADLLTYALCLVFFFFWQMWDVYDSIWNTMLLVCYLHNTVFFSFVDGPSGAVMLVVSVRTCRRADSHTVVRYVMGSLLPRSSLHLSGSHIYILLSTVVQSVTVDCVS